MLKKTLLAAVVLGLSTTAVQAYEVSGYVTGSIGQARADKPKLAKEIKSVRDEIGSLSGFSSRTSSDRTDTAYKIAVGLQANPYVALELQYIDLGESSYKTRLSGSYDNGVTYQDSGKVKLDTSGFGANLVGTYPIEGFTLFAKAGYHYLKTKGSAKYSYSQSDGYSGSASESKTIRKWTPSFGVGASYNITPELAVVAEYERYQGVADKKVTIDGDKYKFKHDIDFASVGLRYNF